MSDERSFTHSQFCKLYQEGIPHPAHDLGDRYRTNNCGVVERWCVGIGPGSIEIIEPGDAGHLPVWRYRR